MKLLDEILLPYQRAWVEDAARFKIGLWSRQTGKSFSTACEAVLHCLLHPGALWVVLSAGERQAIEWMRKARQWAEAVKLAIEAYDELRQGQALMTRAEIAFANKSRILAIPANPDTARGYSANLVLDEFAIHEKPWDIWAAIYPSITNPLNGRKLLRVVSTPKGMGNKFADLWFKNPAYSKHKVTILDAKAQGLPVDLEELRAGVDDPDIWAQEYLCEFIDSSSVLLPYDLIAACEDASLTGSVGESSGAAAYPSLQASNLPNFYIGMDVGRSKDLSVIMVGAVEGGILRLLRTEILRKTPFHEQLDILCALANAPLGPIDQASKPPNFQTSVASNAARRVAIDATGIGAMLAEEARRRLGGRVEPVTFTAKSKGELYAALRRRFEDKTLRIPADRDLREDLHAVQRNVSAGGTVTYAAPRSEDGHSDRTSALALLICAERRAGALIDLDWTIRPKAAARAKGFDQTLADEQAAFLEQAYGQAEERNLFPAIEHLASAFFRGHAHVQPKWSADGQGLLGFDLLDAWNVCRDVVTGRWHWNPEASESVDLATLPAIPPRELVTLVRTRHVDYPAMAIYLRAALGERAWGRFLERYGVPPVIITMPPDMDPARVSDYCAAAEKVADGGTGALPAGSLVTYATEARGTNPFSEFLLHQQKLIVLMATGGMLTSLDGATGIGQGATDAHEETWRTIVRRDAGIIATALNRTVTDTLLDRAFPGRPHLAAFDFETEPAPGPAEVFDLAAKAVQAGYRVTQAELQERTGYALEAAQGAGSGGLEEWKFGGLASPLRGDGPSAPSMPWGVGQSRGGRATPALNRQTSKPQNLQTSGLQGLSEALQADCAPLAHALQTLLAEPSPEAARALAARLPELLPEDPALASEIQTLLDETFTAESANGESRIANREYKRDENGKFSKTNHPGTRPREGETPSKRDAHGTFDEATLAADPKANAERARSVVTHLMAKRGGSEPKALYRQDTGWIGIDYGAPGNKDNAFAGGHGLAHILAKHPKAKESLVDTLQKGEAYKHPQSASKLMLIHGNTVAVLTKRRDGRLLITDYVDVPDQQIASYKKGGRYHAKGEN